MCVIIINSKEKTSVFKKVMFLILFLTIIQLTSVAQKTWNLSNCIDYALENNIDLNKKINLVETQKINLMESKASLLPSLNLGSTVDLNYGRNIDGNTNAITYDQTLRNSYWVNSSVNIFQGLVKYNSVKFNNYLLSAKIEETQVNKNVLIIKVLTYYYTVLYSIGLADVAKSQVDLSEMQYQRMQKFVDVGKESPITVQELKSQWAADKLSFTRTENNLSKALLDLKQLLRIDANQPFDIDTAIFTSIIVEPIPGVDSLFNKAVAVLPEIKQQQFLLNASVKDLAIAKGNISPRLYVSGGFSTGYFDGDTLAFNSQINNNQNQWINMGITIPIFNQASVYSRIKRKKIAVKDRELDLQKQRDDLYTEIWTAIDDLQSAEKEYLSSIELQGFSKLTLQNVTKRMDKGLASTTDFESAKQRFVSAQAGLLKSKLIYVMRSQMLQFYKTGNWNHLR